MCSLTEPTHHSDAHIQPDQRLRNYLKTAFWHVIASAAKQSPVPGTEIASSLRSSQ